MNKEQENRLSMYYAVAKYLDEQSSVLGAVPALVAATLEFQANIDALEAATEKQVIDITGFAKDKAEAEDKMIALTLAVAGGTRAYATVIGDSVLIGKMNVTASALRKHRDAVVAQHSQAIHGEANAVVDALADYGVTAALLADLQNAIDRYVAAIAAPPHRHHRPKGRDRRDPCADEGHEQAVDPADRQPGGTVPCDQPRAGAWL